MDNMFIINPHYDERYSGIDSAQVEFRNKGSKSYNFLLDYFLYKNNYGSNKGEPLPESFYFEDLLLRDGAILTDVLSLSNISESFGFLVNLKFKEIIESHRSIKYQLFPVKIWDQSNKKYWEYFWYYPLRLVDEIDFKRSLRGCSRLKIKNEQDYINLRKLHPILVKEIEAKYSFISPKAQYEVAKLNDCVHLRKCYLKVPVFDRYNLVAMKYDQFMYCDDTFRDACSEKNITGIEFIPIPKNEFKYIF